jgi:hypothetical protein
MGWTGKTLKKVNCYSAEDLLEYQMSFETNGASDPPAATVRGKGVTSVVHTSTGTWTVTLGFTVKTVLAAAAAAQIASAANIDTNIQVGLITIGTSSTTIVVRNNPGGAVADIANDGTNNQNRISLDLWLQIGALS